MILRKKRRGKPDPAGRGHSPGGSLLNSQLLSSPCAPRINWVSAKDDKIPNTKQHGERSAVRFTKADGACGGSSDPRKRNNDRSPQRSPAGYGGWEAEPALLRPQIGTEPAVLISYITSKPTGSWSLILRNTLADGSYLKVMLPPNFIHFRHLITLQTIHSQSPSAFDVLIYLLGYPH